MFTAEVVVTCVNITESHNAPAVLRFSRENHGNPYTPIYIAGEIIHDKHPSGCAVYVMIIIHNIMYTQFRPSCKRILTVYMCRYNLRPAAPRLDFA